MTVWDVRVAKTLRQGDARFEIDVAFESDAARIALHGPSGAGKTQALKMIAGIVRPDAGHVRIAGRALERLPPQQRRLAVVFQDYALFPHLTVRQNVAFAAHRGWLNPRPDAADAAAERWLERFGLGAVASLKPHQLSGGQRQRTALARALVIEPAALLLDEPFAALDAALRARLRDELAALQRTLAIPMLLVTHDDDDLRQLADAVLPIDGGRAGRARQPSAPVETPSAS